MMIFLCTLYFLRANFYYQNHQIAHLWHMVSVNRYIITFLLEVKNYTMYKFPRFFRSFIYLPQHYKKIDTYYYSIFWEKKKITMTPFIINCWLFLQKCWTVLWCARCRFKTEIWVIVLKYHFLDSNYDGLKYVCILDLLLTPSVLK